jgi:hypothetical protein
VRSARAALAARAACRPASASARRTIQSSITKRAVRVNGGHGSGRTGLHQPSTATRQIGTISQQRESCAVTSDSSAVTSESREHQRGSPANHQRGSPAIHQRHQLLVTASHQRFTSESRAVTSKSREGGEALFFTPCLETHPFETGLGLVSQFHESFLFRACLKNFDRCLSVDR